MNDATLSEAFRDLEPKLCDLKNMARLTSAAIEEAIGSPSEVTGRPDCYFIPEGQCEALSFSVYHLESMIISMWTDYYARMEAKEVDEVQSPRTNSGTSRPATAAKAGDPTASFGAIPGDLIEKIEVEILAANGIVTAINGLECLDQEQKEGVAHLQQTHVYRLESARDRMLGKAAE